MLKDKRQKVADVLRSNITLQKLFEEFGIDFESVQNSLIKNALIANDSVIQANTIYALSENPTANSAIATLNQKVSENVGLYPSVIESPHESHYRNYTSSLGTKYTYFLKWLYYTYKFFNEEQFFFNNLLNHYVPKYDSEIISSTNNLKIYFDGLGILLDTLDNKIENLYSLGDIDVIEDQFLQYMGQLLGYQKEDFSIQNVSFRELIKNLTDIYKTKGTHYSFDLFFKLLGFDTQIREYYWDRDAQNPEEFGSIDETSYLYYLTTQDPRLRTVKQTSLTNDPPSIQPINTSDWSDTKDLRMFNQLLAPTGTYTLEEVLGFRNSSIPVKDRFSYFKTNFIQFKLSQYYTKQDLTAKDTETILKYVKFLTPIYVSAFVEVVTTPYQDFYEMENPDAGSVQLDGDPGTPPWIDILLPFLYVTLREYIPLQLAPASESAIVIANNGWSDLNSDGYTDSALPTIFGVPAYGIQTVGTVDLSSPVDLSTNKFLAIKLDKGRGTKFTIQGNQIQNYSQLLSYLNLVFATSYMDATVERVGIAPHYDLRVYSNSPGPTSKILMLPGLSNDLFSSLSANLLTPVDGYLFDRGYQDFGLDFADLSNVTGLNPALNYNFYINLNVIDYSEVDASGPVPATSSETDIVNAINNHYDLSETSSFVISANVEYIASDVTTSNKVAIAYRDLGTNNGRLVLMNSDGSIYRSGLNFTLFDCRNIALASSKDDSAIDRKRFLIAWYDESAAAAKWTVYDEEGNKLFSDSILDSNPLIDIVATTLSDNKIVVAYTYGTSGKVKAFDLTGTPAEIFESDWSVNAVTPNSTSISALGAGFVVGGNVGTGGIVVYFNNDGSYKLGGPPDLNSSTILFTTQQTIGMSLKQTVDGNLFISYKSDNISDYKAYIAVRDATGAPVTLSTAITDDDINFLDSTNTSNGNILIAYNKNDDVGYFQVLSPLGTVYKKERAFYSSTTFSEMAIDLQSNGDITFSLVIPNRGYFANWSYLGEIASLTGNYLTLSSSGAGEVWDDNVNNYADTTDHAHFFRMGKDAYEYDNFAEANRAIGVNFINERNAYNTFFSTSPSDDLLDLVEDTLRFAFTLLIGVSEQPVDRVDATGFHVRRNGYISRNQSQLSYGNREKGYYTRKLDYSEPLRTDLLRINKEINWPQWKKNNATYEEWSSWTLGIDYLEYSAIAVGGYFGNGRMNLSGHALSSVPVEKQYIGTGGMVFVGGYTKHWIYAGSGSITITGTWLTARTNDFFYEALGGVLHTSGTAAPFSYTWNFRYTGSGALHLSGHYSGFEVNVIYTASGSMTLSGTALSLGDKNYIGFGAMVLSGTSAYELSTQIYVYTAVPPVYPNELRLSGAAEYTFEKIYYPIFYPGAVLSGSAIVEGHSQYIYVPQAPIVMSLSGAAVTIGVPLHIYVGSGSMILSGAASTYYLIGSYIYVGSGGAVTLGGAASTREYTPPAGGGMAIFGSATYSYVTYGYFTYSGSGSMTLSGSSASEQQRYYSYSPSGSITASGAASSSYTQSYEYIGSGTAFTLGVASYQEFGIGYEYTPSGGIALSGSAAYQASGVQYVYTPTMGSGEGLVIGAGQYQEVGL